MRLRPTLITGTIAVALVVGAGLAGSGLASASDRVVVVVAGDTLGGIATRVGVPVETLVELNALADPDHIEVGQRLKIRTADELTHRVAPGETLSSIAAHYRTSVEAIALANGISDPSYLQAGAVLRIPGGSRRTNPRPRGPSAVTHRVAPGETVWSIAAHYGTSIEAIALANGISDPSYLQAGAVLRIPRASSGVAPASGLSPAMAATAASRAWIRHLITAEARAQGVPVAFALAVAWQESGWQQGVRSGAGAIGVMQLLPATADWVGASILGERVEITSARSNIRAGVGLLGYYLRRYGNDRGLTLAAYYQGMTATDLHGIYPVTQPYIASILALEKMFRG